MLVILLFGLGSVRLALATSTCDNTDELPKDGSYGFAMQGSNVIAAIDVPTTAISGVFTTTGVNTMNAAFFNVTGGSFILNDDGNLCTGTFTGSGQCQVTKVTGGTMTLTVANLTPVTMNGCNTIDSAGGTLTLQYGLFNSESAMFLMDIDSDTYSVVGEAQRQ